MSLSYSVTTDPSRKLLHVRLSGFFELKDVVALETEKRAALAQMNCGRNQHYSLIDVSGCKLQPQDVCNAFKAAIADPRFMARRIAFVTENSLARMQVRRIVQRDDANIFETVEAAEAWLFEPVALRRTG